MCTVSVLIPCYNRAEYLPEAVESLLRQTYRDLEILIVDDGSEDDPRSALDALLLSEEKGFRAMPLPEGGCIYRAPETGGPEILLLRQEHAGISAARNLGIAKSRGRYLAFLDADDLWAPDKAEKQVRYLEEHPECRIIFTLYENFSKIDPKDYTERQRALMTAPHLAYMAGAMVRREVFDRCGGFRPELPYGEDTEWLARIRAMGVDLGHTLEEVLYFRRIHDGNITLTYTPVPGETRGRNLAAGFRNALKRREQ